MKILTISSLYPNSVQPSFGVFVENRLRHLVEDTEVAAKVIAPVPWFPVKHAFFGRYGKLAGVPAVEERHGLDVLHPRFLVIPKFGAALTPRFLYQSLLKAAKHLIAGGFDPDVIDAHYLYPDGVAAVALGKALNKPVVLTARGSDVTEIAMMKGYRQRIVAACNAAAHVITVSNSLNKRLSDMGVTSPLTTLRNGVDLRMFPCAERAPNDRFKLVFAGWLIPRKRVDLVLDAAALVDDMDVDIVGSGPEEAALRAQVDRLGLAERVRFLGQVPPAQMPGVLASGDALILPSEREGWANVLLEAMACGTPVIASAVDGAIDLVTEDVAGRLVHEQSGKAYADAIQDLGQRLPARRDVHDFAASFGWEETSRGQAKIFEQVTSAAKTGSV